MAKLMKSSSKRNNSLEVTIANRKIGANHPPYVIAELSGNHNGCIERAFDTIKMAKEMGADAIKLQTYTADTLTIDCDKDDFKIKGGLWDGYTLYELYKWAHTPFEWHKDLFEFAKKQGITCFSTPFDETAVDLLEDLNAPAYKIASFEAVDLPLIKYVAATKKPMIISTGMANLAEISEAVETARAAGCKQLVLLHCISGYPAPIDESNLMTISDMKDRFNTLVGLSDHTLGSVVSSASVALGACVIEKHVTLNRDDKGPDSGFSLEPNEFQKLCLDVRNTWKSLGVAGYERKPVEEESIKFRRSIYIVKDIKEGEVFTSENIRRIRPGYGLPPKYYDSIIGRKAACDLSLGTPLLEKNIVPDGM